MTEQLPFLRYVAKMDIIPNNFFTKAHDCRFIYMLEGECEFYTKDKTSRSCSSYHLCMQFNPIAGKLSLCFRTAGK